MKIINLSVTKKGVILGSLFGLAEVIYEEYLMYSSLSGNFIIHHSYIWNIYYSIAGYTYYLPQQFVFWLMSFTDSGRLMGIILDILVVSEFALAGYILGLIIYLTKPNRKKIKAN